MDLLAPVYARLAACFRAMTPGSRIVAGGLVLVAAVSLGYLCVAEESAPSASKTQNHAAAVVGTSDSADAPGDPIDAAIDRDKPWFWQDQRKVIYNNAEEKKLEKEITDFFTDVARAEVTLSTRVEARQGRPRPVPIASICVKMKPGATLSPRTGVMICNYVADAAGRESANVTVFEPRHRNTFRGDRHLVVNEPPNGAVAARRVKQECLEKLRYALRFIPDAAIVVHVPVDATPSETLSTMTANQPRQLPGAQDDKTLASEGLAATRPVRASIRVPRGYFARAWRDAGDPAEFRAFESREIERIQRLAADALPAADETSDPADRVTVVSFADAPSPEPKRRVAMAGPALRPIEYGTAAGLLALAVAAALVVRSLVRRGRRQAVIAQTASTLAALEEPKIIAPAIPRPRRDDPSGIELDGQLARRLIQRRLDEKTTPAPFGILQKTDPRRIARVLADELPRTIALVLSHLAPRQAGRVLVCFAPRLQAEVLRRLVDIEQTSPEVLGEIEAMLASRLAEQVPMQPRSVAGRKAVGGILEAAGQPMLREILGNLAAHDPALATEFASCVERATAVPSLDDLARLDAAQRNVLCEAAGDELLAMALVGVPAETADPFLDALPLRRAESLRRSLDCPRPLRLSDVDAARAELIELAQSLAAMGTLTLPEETTPASLSMVQ
ncbi:MAG TPA: FliG C-terminal domain-containing protein [Thermoguttaceae bacterium]|nr:FliG C-terminal domain-containing protein [Thermoguttaceae bacterium]